MGRGRLVALLHPRKHARDKNGDKELSLGDNILSPATKVNGQACAGTAGSDSTRPHVRENVLTRQPRESSINLCCKRT
jgi:hypothetical protein